MIRYSSTFRIVKALIVLLFFNYFNAFSQNAMKIDSNDDDQALVILAVSKLNRAMVDRDQ